MAEALSQTGPEPTSAEDEQPFLVIGIDFGTTYSGVAWAWSHKPKDIDIISSWEADSNHNSDSDKVPSCIEYDKDCNVIGWGFDGDPGENCFQLRWFKLLLSADAQRDAGEKVQEARRVLNDLKKQPVDAVADYLNCLWTHTITILEGKRLSRRILDNLVFRVVVTVPAAWDHYAQDLMREAATRAGIRAPRAIGQTTVQLIAEPEAAALAAFDDAGLQWQPDLELGDVFVVCDAGGGTVDLVSYKIASVNPLRLTMCVIATSGFCGTITLDEKFERVLRTFVGGSTYDKIKPEIKARFLNDDWEHRIKRNFKEGPGEWRVFMPKFRSGIRSRSGVISLQSAHIEHIFLPACNEITDLVRDQVRQAELETSRIPKVILLVGGFGDNRYLFQQLEKSFKGKGISVRQPSRAWTAVSRGAVMRGLSRRADDETITNFISKYHYGVPFDIYIDKENAYKAQDQMEWYLHKGQSVNRNDYIRFDWYKRIVNRSQLRSIQLDIYISDSNEAPTYKDSIKRLCTINCQPDDSIYDQLPLVNMGSSTSILGINALGTSYRKLELTLIMHISAGNLEWLVFWGSKQLGRTEFKVNYVQ